MAEPPAIDRFARLRAMTPARIGLGRAGQSLPTAALLDFTLAHARARDAVHAALDVPAMIAAFGEGTLAVASRAATRTDYLQRPDLGRALDPASAAVLVAGDYDAAFVVADGLSAAAVHAHAAPLVAALRERLRDWRLAPAVVATQARVALGDAVAVALDARLVIVLIGERPGLSAADSLGAYMSWAPRIGMRDSERNCVSNIRPPHGLAIAAAADRIAWLMREARARKLGGVALKEGAALPPPD